MSEFKDALSAIEAATKAAHKSDKAFNIAREEWMKVKTAYGPTLDDKAVSGIKDLIKKYGPMAMKLAGAGGMGTVAGALLENEGMLSGLFNTLTSLF